MKRIMVGTPSYSGEVVMEFCRSFAASSLLCATKGIYLDLVPDMGSSLIQVSRNWLMSEFLRRPEYTHLFWIDADLGWEPDAPLKLLESDKDAIAGVYAAKLPYPCYPYDAAGGAQGVLQPAKRVPGGFVMLRRKVVEAVAARCEKYTYERHNETREDVPYAYEVRLAPHERYGGKPTLIGEDYSFSDKVIEAGFEIWVRTDIYFVHVGRRFWEAKLSELLKEHGRDSQ